MPSANSILKKEQNIKGTGWLSFIFLGSLLLPYPTKIGTIVLMPHRILLVALFVPIFFQVMIRHKIVKPVLPDYLVLLSAIWVAPALIANHGFAATIEPFGIHLLEFFGSYLIGRFAVRSPEDFIRTSKMLFWLTVLLLPFAAIESLTNRAILLEILPGSSVPKVDAGQRLGLRRAQTTFSHPILYGVFVSTGLGVFWYAFRSTHKKIISTIVVIMSTFFSLSTGALLSVVVQLLLVLYNKITKGWSKRWQLLLLLFCSLYLAIDILSTRTPFHVLVTYASFSTESAYNRIHIWDYGTASVLKHPIFGIGFGEWERPNWMSASIDNFWLVIAIQFGLPAVIALIAAISIIYQGLYKISKITSSLEQATYGYAISLAGLIVAGGTVHYWHGMMSFVMFFLGSGVWITQSRTLATVEDDAKNSARDQTSIRLSRFDGIQKRRRK